MQVDACIFSVVRNKNVENRIFQGNGIGHNTRRKRRCKIELRLNSHSANYVGINVRRRLVAASKFHRLRRPEDAAFAMIYFGEAAVSKAQRLQRSLSLKIK